MTFRILRVFKTLCCSYFCRARFQIIFMGQSKNRKPEPPSPWSDIGKSLGDTKVVDRSFCADAYLVITLTKDGEMERPTILFDYQKPKIEESIWEQIIEQEMCRCDPGVDVLLGTVEGFISYEIKKKHQFVSILPLNWEEYCKSEFLHVETKSQKMLKTIEQSLNPSLLLKVFEQELKQECNCENPNISSKMVQCANVLCPFEWYHTFCVGETASSKENWICDICCMLPAEEQKELEPLHLPRKYRKILRASDRRIECTRALYRAWSRHTWLNIEDICRFYEFSRFD